MAMVREVASKEGISDDEAATRLVQREIAKRIKKRTGKAPGKVYGFKKR